MPRKKAETTEQATQDEQLELPHDGGTEQLDLTEQPAEGAAERDETESGDMSESDETQQVGPDGDLPEGSAESGDENDHAGFDGPLDIERKLEEEIAALNAELAAAEETERDAEQDSITLPDSDESAQPLSEPSAPKRAARTKRKTVKDSSPDEDAQRADPEDPVSAIPPEPTALAARNDSKQLAKAAPGPANFYQADFRHLDRGLTEQERQEWNDIYASFRSQSILTGTVVGVDQNELPVKDKNGKVEMRVINSLVVIGYRVKVLIPENAVWFKGEERGTFLMRGMIGATVDYVIINIDREGEVALASRGLALVKRRRAFSTGRAVAGSGSVVDCSVTVVGPMRCLLTCGGYDIPMRPEDMSYTSILDMRDMYRPGQKLKARVKTHHPAQGLLRISVKEAESDPFDGAERRHPVGSRRQAVITSKYKGGIFCAMPDGTVCLCLYSNLHYDSEFLLGDSVIIYIAEYNYKVRHIFGRIVSKW